MPLVMTQVYLEAAQKKALSAKAKKMNRTPSELLRDAVDALLLGVTTDELKQLDEATKLAKTQLDEMINILDENAKAHKAFMKTIAKLRQESSK